MNKYGRRGDMDSTIHRIEDIRKKRRNKGRDKGRREKERKGIEITWLVCKTPPKSYQILNTSCNVRPNL
jgi:hypothetical protein